MLDQKIPLVIVESHQHVLEHVHDAIRRHKLFNKPWSMLHFDAHPDLACSVVAPAIACFTPRHFNSTDGAEDDIANNLYELLDSTTTGIAEWIMPLVVAANLSRIEWVKPTFSNQLPLGIHDFTVGAEAEHPEKIITFLDLPWESRIKVDWHHPYYLDDDSVVHVGKLALKRNLKLVVTQLPSYGNGCGVPSLTDGSGDDYEPWLLDICLDFFVCRNPYIHDIEEVDPAVARSFLDLMKSSTIAIIESVNMDYERDAAIFYELLVKTLELSASNGSMKDPEWIVTSIPHNLSRFFGSTYEANKLITDLKKKIDDDGRLLTLVIEAVPNWSMPHMFIEDVSSLDYIDESLRRLEDDLRGRNTRRNRPFLITMSRSSLDGFTPGLVVENLQSKLITMLERIFCTVDGSDSHCQLECSTEKNEKVNECPILIVRDYGQWEGSTVPSK
jgi:hypothetical protein